MVLPPTAGGSGCAGCCSLNLPLLLHAARLAQHEFAQPATGSNIDSLNLGLPGIRSPSDALPGEWSRVLM